MNVYFPELPYHPVKDGDKTSDWFNRSLLKERLGFEKTAAKSPFVSNAFLPGLKQAGSTARRVRSLLDISRFWQTENRYSKDHPPAALYPVLEALR